MPVEPTQRAAFQGWIVGWLVALILAFGIAYLMFSTVKTVVERHTAAPATAVMPSSAASR
jgi:hypothetical protein